MKSYDIDNIQIITVATNKGIASSVITCKFKAMCSYLNSVLVDCFVLLNQPEQKA